MNKNNETPETSLPFGIFEQYTTPRNPVEESEEAKDQKSASVYGAISEYNKDFSIFR
jgi:hypothetical protein